MSVCFFILSRHTAASVSSLIVNMFQGTGTSKNCLREYYQHIFIIPSFFFFSSFSLPFLLEFQFFLKLGLLILHPAGQDQIIVRDVPLMQHGHVFLLPVDKRNDRNPRSSRSRSLSLYLLIVITVPYTMLTQTRVGSSRRYFRQYRPVNGIIRWLRSLWSLSKGKPLGDIKVRFANFMKLQLKEQYKSMKLHPSRTKKKMDNLLIFLIS